MRFLPLFVLGLVLLATPARASEPVPAPQEVPESSAPFRDRPAAFALGPSLGALGGGLLIGGPSTLFLLGAGIGFGGPAYHLLAFPTLGPIAGMVLGDLLSGQSPVGAWGGALLGAAVGTAGGAAFFYSGMYLQGMVGLALLPPLGAVLGRALVVGLTGEPAPAASMAARSRSSVVWTLAPARLGESGTGAVVMGWW
ncbi:hypothetical protein ATI61_11649 [Archangium gephyra]|uniref:Uncharacterized protein n=1 Tax=Archangium gephyra TaxID=48 RepID=A0AAC8QAJ5_9BACT|nr:hypothetical protein [Archangium gephyra]AKJ03800.1 Hypothetical protein AA314_05426 [Archangium gephyra]REG23579.1 hypothetical protein ATI61_11649 [Archangium gephyra]